MDTETLDDVVWEEIHDTVVCRPDDAVARLAEVCTTDQDAAAVVEAAERAALGLRPHPAHTRRWAKVDGAYRAALRLTGLPAVELWAVAAGLELGANR
jgi:hypothetical protein